MVGNNPSSVIQNAPPLFNVMEGDGPLIITGPHNGYFVPSALYTAQGDPLGVSAEWFDPQNPEHLHNTCDWGVQPLFEVLKERFSGRGITFLEATHSRLVADLNRTEEHFITASASDIGVDIPANNNLSAADIDDRKARYYTPWVEALAHTFNRVKEKHGYAIILDLHSFSPVFKGQAREVDIGTINPQGSRFSAFAESFLAVSAAKIDYVFRANEPYNLNVDPCLNESVITLQLMKQFGIEYCGLELKNGFLQNAQHFNNVSRVVGDLVEHTLANAPALLKQCTV